MALVRAVYLWIPSMCFFFFFVIAYVPYRLDFQVHTHWSICPDFLPFNPSRLLGSTAWVVSLLLTIGELSFFFPFHLFCLTSIFFPEAGICNQILFL